MTNSFQSSLCQAIRSKLQLYDFSWPAITLMGYDHELADLKQQATYLELEAHLSNLPRNTLSYLLCIPSPTSQIPYCITILKFRRVLPLARFNILPKAVIEGKYWKITFQQRLCSCVIETMELNILYSPLFTNTQQESSLFFSKHPGHSDLFYFKLLLWFYLTIAKHSTVL